MENYILSYYQQIKDGTVLVGVWIKKLYEMIVNGLASGSFFYDSKKAHHAIDWIEAHCFHVEGELAPNNLKLELWQKAMVSSIFGLVDENGKLAFREVFLLIGRKNGKSLLGSAIENYVLRDFGGYGARAYNIAPKLDQADIIYLNTWSMIQLDPDQIERKAYIESLRKETHSKVEDDPEVIKKRASDIFYPRTNSTLKKIAFSSKKSDGFNPSLALCDEIAAWEGDKGLKQYEVMKSGTGARSNALIISMTTANYISDGIFDELMKRATRLLLGDSKERKLLPFLYMIDDIEKWNDINELMKANPQLGKSIPIDYMIEEIAIAEGSLSKKAEFMTKYANIKQNSSLAWLSAQDVDAISGEPIDINELRGCYCVGGLDLSQTTDLTCACVVIEKNGKLNVVAHFWLPSQRIDEATERDGVPYWQYVKRGILSPSGDNFVDYRDCYQWFVNLVENYEILPLQVGYDRYSAQYLIQDMEAYGFHTDDVFQGDNLWPVLQEMEGLIKDKRINIGDNDLLKMHLLNSAIKMNTERGRGRLIKINANSRIDGTASLSDAFCVRQKWYGEIGSQLSNE